MSNYAFSKAMEQIAREAEQIEEKARAESIRAAKIARIRKICMVIMGIGLVAFAYTHRKEFGQKVFNVVAEGAAEADRADQAEKAAAAPATTPTTTGVTAQNPDSGSQKMSKNIQALRAAAAARDNAVDDLTKR
ncbi:MAG: hypothetical protein RLY20_1006 [Verrucomicrobiota bacterium]|jgi:cell division septal protein FtsQ